MSGICSTIKPTLILKGLGVAFESALYNETVQQFIEPLLPVLADKFDFMDVLTHEEKIAKWKLYLSGYAERCECDLDDFNKPEAFKWILERLFIYSGENLESAAFRLEVSKTNNGYSISEVYEEVITAERVDGELRFFHDTPKVIYDRQEMI